MFRPIDSHANIVCITEELVSVFSVASVFIDNAGVETEPTHQVVFIAEDLTASFAGSLVDLGIKVSLLTISVQLMPSSEQKYIDELSSAEALESIKLASYLFQLLSIKIVKF